MDSMICEMPVERVAKRSRIQDVLRVAEGDRYLGDILLDTRGRVWRHADTIPADVVLKAYLAYARQDETCGQVVGRKDGRKYTWYVVGLMAEAA